MGNIFPEPVKIPQICQITFHDNISGKGQRRIQLFPNPVRQCHIRVITVKPVQHISHSLFCGNPFLKLIIKFDQGLKKNGNVLQPAFISKYNAPPELGIKSR